MYFECRSFFSQPLLIVLHILLVVWFPTANAAESTETNAYTIGVYYYAGWKNNQPKASAAPWERIKEYPERKPLLGWYEEDADHVIDRQLKWMGQNGISFVAFDLLWGSDGRPYRDHALKAYLLDKDKHGVNFSILWANHTDYNYSESQLIDMFNYWAQHYFSSQNYLRLDGKPVVFLFSAEVFARNAKIIGKSVEQLMEMVDVSAKKVGLPGVIVVGGASGNSPRGFKYSRQGGFSAFSAYNYHGGADLKYARGSSLSQSYQELDDGYRDQWRWFIEKTDALYFVPMTSGWDRRPWGGSKDSLHDRSLSSPEEFGKHLMAAKEFIDRHRDRTRGLGVICCWNEFGEGSFIEPTEQGGFAYLQEVRRVFGKQQVKGK